MFLDLFLEILTQTQEARILKVLFTTDGFCHRLRKKLNPEEQLDFMNNIGKAPSRNISDIMSPTDLAIIGGSHNEA